MWEYEYAIETLVRPEAIWQAWSDVETWAAWNPGVRRAEIDGRFAPGSTVTMHMPDGAGVALRIVQAEPGTLFTDEAHFAGAVIRTEHRIERLNEHHSRVVYATRVTGEHAQDIGTAITADFQQTVAGLLAHAGA